MNVLVTTSRMPFALEAIRKLGETGHRVFATDTFSTAPGSHSKYVTEWFVNASPRFETRRFIDDIAGIVKAHAIDLVVPAFEEAMYLAVHRDRIPAPVFTAPFDVLRRLHDKAAFVEVCRAAGVPVPDTVRVESRDALRESLPTFPEYLARPAFSRGGVQLLTGTGPLAGAYHLERCKPTPENPWIVQRYVHGTEVCTFSVAREGRVLAHSAYVHPKTLDHAGGIVLNSVDDPDTLAMVQRIVRTVGYTGQLGMDFISGDGRLHAIECNPRATLGVALMPAPMYHRALFDPNATTPEVAPAGERLKIDFALVRDMLRHWREIPSDLVELFSGAPDVYAKKGDRMPALYAFLSYTIVNDYRRRVPEADRTLNDLADAQFHDVSWNGEAIEN